MKWDILRTDTVPRPPPRPRAVAIAAGIGAVTGFISSLPSPLPDLRLQDPELLINAEGIPLHAGVAFGAGVALILWLWAKRDPGKCLLAMALTLMGWLAAVNTANDVMQALVGSELFGTVHGAKANRRQGMAVGGADRRRHRCRPYCLRRGRPLRSDPAAASLGTDRTSGSCAGFYSIPPPWPIWSCCCSYPGRRRSWPASLTLWPGLDDRVSPNQAEGDAMNHP